MVMRKRSLAVVISSLLLGAVAAQAQQPSTDTSQSQQAQTTQPTPSTQTDTSDTSTSPGDRSEMHRGQGNVDNSAASSTSEVPGSDRSLMSTSHWSQADTDHDGNLSQAELTSAAPMMSDRFSAIDANGDRKLTRDEFRQWHDAHPASMDADRGTRSTTDDSSQGTSSTQTTTSDSSSTSQDQTSTRDTGPNQTETGDNTGQ
jgi:hypothetical protein